MKSRAPHNPRPKLYNPSSEIHPSHVQFLQAELDRYIVTVKKLREERDTFEARMRIAQRRHGICTKCSGPLVAGKVSL